MYIYTICIHATRCAFPYTPTNAVRSHTPKWREDKQTQVGDFCSPGIGVHSLSLCHVLLRFYPLPLQVAPTVLEGLKEDPTSRQQAKKGDHPVVAPAGAMAVKAPPKEVGRYFRNPGRHLFCFNIAWTMYVWLHLSPSNCTLETVGDKIYSS